MIRSVSANNTQVYHLSAGKSLPEFLKDAQKGKSLRLVKCQLGVQRDYLRNRRDREFRKRLELIQDFEFPISSSTRRFPPSMTLWIDS